MDQIKIGKFIANCRKEKNMTQQQLADINRRMWHTLILHDILEV